MRLTKIGRRIFIGVGMVVMLLGAMYMYLDHQNRTKSPPGNDKLTNGELTVSVDYSRPSVKGRLIFGEVADGALQPWGQYWRLGANEPTSLTINQDVMFNGQALDAGTYQLYAVPSQSTFKIGVNTEDRVWGYSEPNYGADILSTEVPVILNDHVEQHTISLKKGESSTIIMVVEFADVKLDIPISLAN